MTDDELDLIASAYVDGEATPEEVALVERDPALQARVEEFRSLSGGLADTTTPPPALKQAHLAAALSEFEALQTGAPSQTVEMDAPGDSVAAESQVDDSVVTDFRERAAARRERPRRPERSLPSWLPAAAAFLVLGGGAIWAVNQAGGGDDDAETASVELEADDAGEDTTSDEATEAGDATAARAAEAPEMAADADADSDSADDSAFAEADATEEADDEQAEGGAAPAAEPEPLPPLLSFDTVPDVDTIEDLPDLETDLSLSRCGNELVFPDLPEPSGFVPVEVAGEPAELFVAIDADGAEIRLLVDASCAPLEL